METIKNVKVLNKQPTVLFKPTILIQETGRKDKFIKSITVSKRKNSIMLV